MSPKLTNEFVCCVFFCFAPAPFGWSTRNFGLFLLLCEHTHSLYYILQYVSVVAVKWWLVGKTFWCQFIAGLNAPSSVSSTVEYCTLGMCLCGCVCVCTEYIVYTHTHTHSPFILYETYTWKYPYHSDLDAILSVRVCCCSHCWLLAVLDGWMDSSKRP